MNEPKYYVKFKKGISTDPSEASTPYLCESTEYGYQCWIGGWKQAFTKSELAKVMDGAFYKQTLSEDILTPDHVYYGSGKEIVEEWTNELIELIPVEDVK